MAQHHGDIPPFDLPRSVLKALERPLVGSTGEYPDGMLTPTDEGGLQFRIVERKGNLVVDFGKPVQWIAMAPEQAVGLAEALIAKARILARKSGKVLSVSL